MKELLQINVEFNEAGEFCYSIVLTALPDSVYSNLVDKINFACEGLVFKHKDHEYLSDLRNIFEISFGSMDYHIDLYAKYHTPMSGKPYTKLKIIVSLYNESNLTYTDFLFGKEKL